MKPWYQTAVVLLLATACVQSVACGQCTEPAADAPPADAPPAVTPSPPSPVQIPDAFPPQVAGQFYPADPDALRQIVSNHLKAATSGESLADRDIVGIVSPHAGYAYSGAVAGEAWAAVADRNYRVVILLAFNHRRRFERAALLQRPAMRTPLGDIPIDTEIAGALLRNEPALFAADETAFTDEHALETQLPFLQVALPDARIVPVLVGADNRNRLESIGAILFARFENRRDVLFAVSSDMSHFFTHETATRTDTATLTALINGRTDEWLDRAAAQQAGMCGVRPLYAFISMFENYPATARAISLLRYQTSADATGERNRVVGYAALAFSVSNEHRKKVSMEKDFGPFGLEERRALMNIARTAVKNATIGRTERPAPPELPALNEHGAAFVTLRMNGELRGCIGHVIARMPLFSCVDEVARSAAIHDTRFSPLTPAEFQRVSFEISILTTPEPIRAEHVEVGTHGLIMTRGGRSGLLLPQVPVEWGWDREGFLAATCRKAGLPTDCWKDPQTEIRAFRAIVFDETDI